MCVKEAKTDMVSGSTQPDGDRREEHHILTNLVIATLPGASFLFLKFFVPGASKECINQAALRWPGAQGGLPREMVFELSTSQSASKEEGVRGTHPSTRAACAKARAWRSESLRRLSVGAGAAGGGWCGWRELGCSELRGAVGLFGCGLCPKSKCVFADLCVCVCMAPNQPAGVAKGWRP